ncbi:MAG: hypothetical protein ACLRFG_03690 [Clostridia bacterium]
MKTKSTTYSLTDFAFDKTPADNTLHFHSCHGFAIKNGKLTTGLGFAKLKVPNSTEPRAQEFEIDYTDLPETETSLRVFSYFKGYTGPTQASTIYDRRLHFLGSSGTMYEIRPCIDYQKIFSVYSQSLNFSSLPVALNFRQNGEDMAIFSNATDDMVVWKCSDTAPNTLALDFHLTSLCENDGILYATTDGDEKTIFYTTTLDPELINDTNSGTIELTDERGASKKVISFKGYVYVFREYGITKLTRLSSGEFSISQLYTSPNKIYSNTVTVCGDKILFLARNGIFSFNGINVNKVETCYDDIIMGVDNTDALGACVGEHFYLACRLNYADVTEAEYAMQHNAFIDLNVQTEEISVVRGVDVASMLAVADFSMEKLVVTFNGDNACEIAEVSSDGMYLGEKINKVYETNTIYLPYETRISAVEVEASRGTVVEIVTDNATLHFTCSRNGYNCFTPYAKSTCFKVVVKGLGNDTVVDKLTLITTELV